jgi:LmbE family N-acetylglucosaminyl deacetylase
MAVTMSDCVKFNILFVVCHPDDEALWIGGTLHALSKFPGITISVICLSGADAGSPRQDEFFCAKAYAGYHNGVVLGGTLRAALEPLPPISKTLESGLKELNMEVRDVSLLITHSPYGDEHAHPHHSQASDELYLWAERNDVPFGYFSCIPIPFCRLQPLLINMKRKGAFQILNVSRCKETVRQKAARFLVRKPEKAPKYFIQLLTDMTAKEAMLGCYQSVGWALHADGYAMFTNNCESLYLFDDRGYKVFQYVMDNMAVPGCQNLFHHLVSKKAVLKRMIRNVLGRGG